MISQPDLHYWVIAWIAVAVILFPIQLKITAPYGRHTKSNWGPMISNKLGWFIMEIPALVVFLGFAATQSALENSVTFIFILLWSVHYIHRAVIFPLRIRTKGKRMPVTIALFAFCFNLVNGFFNGYWIGRYSDNYTDSWLADPRFIAGILLFVGGFAINQYHDRILIGYRKKNPAEYVIPQGGLFRYISCPNFLGEIIEWAGFALMVWSLPALSFFIWTFANLVPRAIDHHKWYRRTFAGYPKERKAVIPFII